MEDLEKTYQEKIDAKLEAIENKLATTPKEDAKSVFSAEVARNTMNFQLRNLSNGTINKIVITNATNAEGTDNIGGYLVPQEYGNEVIAGINQYGFARKLSTVKKMTRDKMNFPIVNTDLIAYNISEAAALTASNYVFGTVQLDTTKYAVICPVTNELIQDSAYDLYPEVLNSTAIGFANKEDALAVTQLATCTNTLSADAAGAITTSLTGAVGYAKLIDVPATLESINTNFIKGAVWIMSPTMKAAIRKISDSNGRPILEDKLQDGYTEFLLGYPVVTSNLMPAASSTAAATNLVFFGNPANLYFGDRLATDIYIAKEGSIGGVSLLENDLSAFRLIERIDIKLSRTNSFVKLQTK